MGFIARLRRGTRIINLNTSPFTVGADFTPPGVAETPQIAEGRKRARRTGERRSTQSLSVSVHVQGTTVAGIRANVDSINSFLRQAGKRGDPTYFEWRPDNNFTAEVLIGQSGAYRSAEVFWGDFRYSGEYGIWDRSKLIPDCSLNMVIGSEILGQQQICAKAKGGICEDWIGATDGISRGLMVPEPDETNGNKYTNPVFGNSDWDNGWTNAGSLLTPKQNTDPRFVLYGLNSALLSANTATPGDNTLTQSINVGNTNAHVMSCYAKRPDSTAISSGIVLYYNGNALATTYTSCGNGWYRLTASLTGVNSAVTAGVKLTAGQIFYVDAFQLEERTYATPFFYGDMLGCAWASTVHASKSTRSNTTLSVAVAGKVDSSRGMLRIAWKPDKAGTAFTSDGYMFAFDTNFYAKWDEGDDKWYFVDGSGADIAQVADTFASGDILVFHFDFTNAKLYLDGALADTGAYEGEIPTSPLYLGHYFTTGTPDRHLGGTLLDLQFYDTALTAAEVLADYNNIYPALVAGKSTGSIPYLWTKDGDSIVDYMFTGNYSNIAVIGGVAGSLPAKTEFKAVTAGLNNADVYIGNLDVDYYRFINPEFLTYVGSPDAKTVNTSDTDIAVLSIDDDEFLLLAGRKLALMVRGDEDGSDDISLRTGINPGGAYYYSSYKPSDWIASSTNVSNDLSPELGMLDDEELYRLLGITRAVSIKVQGKRPTGTATFNLYSAQIMPFPMIRLVNTSAAGIATTILYLDGKAREINSAALSYGYSVRGDRDEFGILPGRYNLLVSYLGAEGIATDTGDTLTYSAFYVTPRWALM